MNKKILTLVVFITLIASTAFAEVPTFPGAKPFGAAPDQPTNVKVEVPGMAAINTGSKSHTYTVPATTTFDDVKKFYGAELTKLGYAEKASVNISGMAMPTQSTSYSSTDGMQTVSITLTKNPTNANENLLSVSESSISMH